MEVEVDGSQLEFLPLPKGNFYSIAISPNGRYLCVMMVRVGTNFENILWDIQKEEIINVFEAPDFARFIYFSPDGKYIGVGYSSSVVIYNLNGETVNTILFDLPMAHFAWRPNGKHIAIATYEPYLLVASALEKRRMRCREYPLHYGEYLDRTIGVAWHPDGKRLASLHEYGLTIYEMPYLRVVKHLEDEFTKGGKPPIAYSPDGKYIAIYGAWVFIYESDTLEELPEEQEVKGAGGGIVSYDWRIQKYIVVSTRTNNVVLWNFENDEIEKSWTFKFKEYTYPKQVLMHPSGKIIFVMYRKFGITTLHI